MNWKELKTKSWVVSPHLEAWQKKILAVLVRRAPKVKDILWILSSGTQSVNSVKAISLSFESLLCSAEAVNRRLESGAKDRWALAIPSYHIGGLSLFARAHLSGAKVVEFKQRWSAEKFAAMVASEHITLSALVPTQVHDLVTQDLRAPPALRAVVVGGGSLSESLYFRASALGWPLLPSYGLSECCSQVATARLASLQRRDYPKLEVLEHVQVELREQRIFLKSAALCRWIAVGNSEGLFTLEDPIREGWFATEDMAEMEGVSLKILGRRDDLVKILGVLVPVQEVERRAQEFFAQVGLSGQVCVAAVKSTRTEHQLILFTDGNSSLREWEKGIVEFNRGAMGSRRIGNLCWVPKIPTGALGKLKKSALLHALSL